MVFDILERRIMEAKKEIGINSYRAASGHMGANQIGMLTEREMRGALFLIRLKRLEENRGLSEVGTVTKYTIGG